MSETVPPTPATPDANLAPSPVAGTTPPEAAPSPAVPAPAADFPPPGSSPEAAPDKPPSSLLGTAAPKPEGEPTEPAAAADGEVPGSGPEAPSEPLPLPTYEQFAIPEGVTLDAAKVGEFQTLLGTIESRVTQTPAEAHTAMQEMGQKMLDLYIQSVQDIEQRQTQLNQETFQRFCAEKRAELESDPELGGARIDRVYANVGSMFDRYGNEVGPLHKTNLQAKFEAYGIGDDVDFVRLMNWVSGFIVEKPRMVAATGVRGPQPMSRSQRLYRNSIPPNGAA